MVLLGLLAPFVVAGAIVTYTLFRLEAVARRIDHLERADGVNLALLEIRQFEQDILLFRGDEGVRSFFTHLANVRQSVAGIQEDTASGRSSTTSRTLLDTFDRYEKASQLLVGGVAMQRTLESDIRPLGRKLESEAARQDVASEIRRYEKNFLIYREPLAVERLRARAADLVRMQPSIGTVAGRYLETFDALVRNRSDMEQVLAGMQGWGKEIQTITMELSSRERGDIDRTLGAHKRLSLASLIFLVVSLNAVGYLFSRRVRTTLRSVEEALGGLESGKFAPIDVEKAKLPAEISSLISTYNHTMGALSASKGELERTMALLEDVNREIVERQEDIIEVRNLSAMRLLASEVAREVNAPLSSLIPFLEFMREEVPPSDARRQTLALMLKEATRCREVVGELASFAKKETLAYRPVNPAKLVTDAIEVVKRQHPSKHVDLVASLALLPQSAVIDPVLIHQALVNVLSNAFQFTAEGGSIEVQGRAEGDHMTFTIRDHGLGISREDLPHIFEPFFSTRRDTGGSGLGLALTQKIIEHHRGRIRAESTPGEATVFTIELPLH